MVTHRAFAPCPCLHLNQFNKKAVVWRCCVEKVFLEISQYSRENTCARVSGKKRDPGTGVFCEFCGTSKNIFFYTTPPAAASINRS